MAVLKKQLYDNQNNEIMPKTTTDQVDGLDTQIENSVTTKVQDELNMELASGGQIKTAIDNAVTTGTTKANLPVDLVYFGDSISNPQLQNRNGEKLNLPSSGGTKLYLHSIKVTSTNQTFIMILPETYKFNTLQDVLDYSYMYGYYYNNGVVEISTTGQVDFQATHYFNINLKNGSGDNGFKVTEIQIINNQINSYNVIELPLTTSVNDTIIEITTIQS